MKRDPPKADVYIGRTTFRNERRLFGIAREDRFSHMYIIGKTGTGKSTLLHNLALQDIANGQGLAVFDPHGDLVEGLLPQIPDWRQSDVTYLDVPDPQCRWHFNPVASIAPGGRALAVASMVEVFKKLWPDDWGPRLEHLLRNVLWVLVETPGASLATIPRLLTERDFRRGLLSRVSNEEVRAFWRDEYERYSPGFRSVVAAPLQNKVGAFLSDPLLRTILASEQSSIDLAATMDEGRVLLVNLARGRMGEGPAALIGALLVAVLGLSAFRRASQLPAERRDFFLYLDEFQILATRSLANMLAELRKYRVGLVLAHQHLSQLDAELRESILGNAGSLLSFRAGASDARLIAMEMNATARTRDLTSLPNFNLLARILVASTPGRAFSASTDSPAYQSDLADLRYCSSSVKKSAFSNAGTPPLTRSA